jgi:ribosome-associated toxin RatA of RatAB toxin-antitoxin module
MSRRLDPATGRGAALTLTLIALPAALAAQETAWPLLKDLAPGTVLTRVDDDGRFRGHIDVAVLIAAEPPEIWAVLRDCASAPDYVPNVKSCERVAVVEGGRAEIFRQTVRLAWFLPSIEHEFSLEYEPFQEIRVRRVSGPFIRLDGIWSLRPQPGGNTLLVYSLDFDPGLPLPRIVVGATLRRDLPEVLQAIRDRAQIP